MVYDILCQTADKSKKFIVEMQNSSQAYFTDRSLHYISRAFTEHIYSCLISESRRRSA